jgi:hypothetical protein
MKLDIQLFATTLKDANSNGSSVGGTSNAYNFRYTVVLNSQNKEANTSNITVKHYGKGLQNFTYSGFKSPKSYVYVYNKSGTQIGYGDAVVGSMSTSEKTLCTVTLDIPHDDEGKLTFSVKVVYKPNTTSYNYLPANKTISSGNITNTPQILRAPNVQVDSYEIYNNSIRVGVHSTNSIALNQVQVSYTENGTTYSYMEEVDKDGYIYLLGLNPKTTYTFNLKGYNNANSALETTGVNVTYTTGPNPIGVNSITVDLNNASYNNDSMETWTVGFLANLSYGNGNSISDLYSINYTIEDSQGVVVGTGSKYQNNYASYFYLSELNPEETYKVTAEVLTYITPDSESYWVESASRYFTTLDKNKKIWIKNNQGVWIQGVLYIKTENGWKPAKQIYVKTGEDEWSTSTNAVG